MIAVNLSFIHVVFIIVVTIISIIGIKLLFVHVSTTGWYLRWNYKRQANIQSAKTKTEIEVFYKDIQGLAAFVGWINNVMLKTSKQRKKFWSDFALSESGRKYWVELFVKYVEKQMKKKA